MYCLRMCSKWEPGGAELLPSKNAKVRLASCQGSCTKATIALSLLLSGGHKKNSKIKASLEAWV